MDAPGLATTPQHHFCAKPPWEAAPWCVSSRMTSASPAKPPDPRGETIMKHGAELRFSLLDLAPIRQGGTAAEAFRNTLDLARHAERWGYHRYWLAEHHNLPGIASAPTAVVFAHVAVGTARIRVGSGGIMLPNHAP